MNPVYAPPNRAIIIFLIEPNNHACYMYTLSETNRAKDNKPKKNQKKILKVYRKQLSMKVVMPIKLKSKRDRYICSYIKRSSKTMNPIKIS